jgi:transposase
MKSKSKQSKKVNYTTHYCAKRYDKNTQGDLVQLNPKAAGIDIGAKEIVVAVPRDEGQYDVWVYGTFTKDLKNIVKLLKEFKVDCAAMESTGNYWIPIYEMLEDNGIRPYLANPKNLKNVSGKKTDVLDAECRMVGYSSKIWTSCWSVPPNRHSQIKRLHTTTRLID